jgi:putative SOS response-associated peptidase YedK
MPCILNDDEIDEYLGRQPMVDVYHLLKAFPAEQLDIYPVAPLVNRLRNDGADCSMHVDEHKRLRGIGAMVMLLLL